MQPCEVTLDITVSNNCVIFGGQDRNACVAVERDVVSRASDINRLQNVAYVCFLQIFVFVVVCGAAGDKLGANIQAN